MVVSVATVAKFPICPTLWKSSRTEFSSRTSGHMRGDWLIPVSHHPQATQRCPSALPLQGRQICRRLRSGRNRSPGSSCPGTPPYKIGRRSTCHLPKAIV